jgi:hypothetical protein
MKVKLSLTCRGFVRLTFRPDQDEIVPRHGRPMKGFIRGGDKTSISVGRTGKVRTKPRKPHVAPGLVQMTDDDGALMFYKMTGVGNRVYRRRHHHFPDEATHDGYAISTDATYTHEKYEEYMGFNEETGKSKYKNFEESQRPCDPVMIADYDSEDVTFSSEEEINSKWWDTVRKTNIRI